MHAVMRKLIGDETERNCRKSLSCRPVLFCYEEPPPPPVLVLLSSLATRHALGRQQETQVVMVETGVVEEMGDEGEVEMQTVLLLWSEGYTLGKAWGNNRGRRWQV